MPMDFDFRILGSIEQIETIATGRGIRELRRLRRAYGGRRWIKKKGFALIELSDGTSCRVEVHWYEAHGVGKRELKLKRFLRE